MLARTFEHGAGFVMALCPVATADGGGGDVEIVDWLERA
jgi:hypothetical protein